MPYSDIEVMPIPSELMITNPEPAKQAEPVCSESDFKVHASMQAALQVLGLELETGAMLSWKTVKSAYKKQALLRHPDHGGSSEAFGELTNAIARLKAIAFGNELPADDFDWVEEINAGLDELRASNDRLVHSVGRFEHSVDRLAQSNAEMRRDVEELQAAGDAQQTRLDEFSGGVSEFQGEVSEFQGEVSELRKEVAIAALLMDKLNELLMLHEGNTDIPTETVLLPPYSTAALTAYPLYEFDEVPTVPTKIAPLRPPRPDAALIVALRSSSNRNKFFDDSDSKADNGCLRRALESCYPV